MHVSLDSALGRQRRLNSVGESVLQIAPNAAAAYSLRSLTGGDPKVVRVRRDTGGAAGDNDEQDFTVSGISSGALVDFVGSGNDGFVDTWYDQSGNGNDAEQATAGNQPKIVSSGSLVPDDGIDFDGDDFLVSISASVLTSPFSIFSTSVRDATGYVGSFSKNGAANRYFAVQEGSSTSIAVPRNATSGVSVSASVSGSDRLTFAVTTGETSTSVGAKGGTLANTTDDYGNDFRLTDGINQFSIGVHRTTNPSGYFNGRIREVIFYTSDQSANRSAVETNTANYYNITLV
jgi:hypothetical protein